MQDRFGRPAERVKRPEDYGVRVREMRALRGPNLYAYMPVLHVVLDIGPYEERASDSFPDFPERLAGLLPGLEKHSCSLGRPGGFLERVHRGTFLGHITEHVALELQTQMGFNVAFGRARGTGEQGVYTVVVAYREEEPARAAFETALRLTLAVMHDEPFDLEGELERLHELADEYCLGPSTAAIVAAARARKIPVIRLTPTGSLVQLGYGVHQKRIQASETSQTSAIAVDMCQEKPLTNRMLRTVGVPVPEGYSVASADEAWAAAREIGVPVVVKPEAGNQGKGVCVNLRTEDEVRAAYDVAQGCAGQVLVERYIEGNDYRLLVVGGRMVAASRRDPAQVTGDGTHTVRELVELANQDPRRRPGHSSVLTRLRLDEAADLVLAQQGLTADVVPAAGQHVRLRTNCNLSTGGTATDVTDEVHAKNAHLAELAAQILGLDIAGIDMICRDIARPLDEQCGAIVEVNAAPGLRMHLHPYVGQPRDVAAPIVEMLYPQGAPARIPIIAVTGTNGKTTVTRLIAHMYETAHSVVGMTSTEGAYIHGERILKGDCSGPQSARAVLLHPRVQVAVLETARGGILREGLAFDACSVGVVTNISADHLGMGGVTSLEELARVKQVVIEAVARDGVAVLNAEDPLVAEMAAATDARVIYFGTKPSGTVMAAHLASGGSGVFVEDGAIVLARGTPTGVLREPLVELERVGFTHAGHIPFQVQNALAAVAATWGQGVNPALIVRALTTFRCDPAMVPGRFNVLDLHGVEVVLDYGHNAAAMCALGEALTALDMDRRKRRTIMVLALPGDRRDEDLLATLQATRRFADVYVLHDLDDPRGRAQGEVPQLLRAHLPKATRCVMACTEREAIRLAWRHARWGERIVITVDHAQEALAAVREMEHAACGAHESACDSPLDTQTDRPDWVPASPQAPQ